jgi:competence protein ComFC
MEIQSIGQAIFDLFFPRRCLNCDSIISLDNPLCISCAAHLPYTHWHLNKKNFAYQKLKKLCQLEAAHSLLLFQHDNVTQKLLHNLKYNNHPEIGILLAEKLSSELSLFHYDGIIPVPIHLNKLKKRGYNQVVPYAKTLAERNNIPFIDDVLIRIENNSSQIFKNRAKRLSTIQNAFRLTDKPLDGHILLMDDVLTTGATLSTCVKLIQSKYPDVKISVMTIACAQ